MFPSASSAPPPQTPLDQRSAHDRSSRSPLASSSTTMGFAAGATSSGGGYGNWGGGSTGGPMNDPFAPSRSHYQPGFLMSMTQDNTAPSGGQYFEDPPLIPTKFNPSNSRASPSEFGLDSMFEHPRRQRQPPSDEDAPPTASVNDMAEEPNASRFQTKNSHSGSPLVVSSNRRPVSAPQPASQHEPVIYLNVFGYPSDRYESIARLFRSLGDTTDPEPSENGMWFTIGFRHAWEAERALRRNGKVMDEAYMIGVARAHSSAADATSEVPRPGPIMATNSPPNGDPGKDSLVPAFALNRSSNANSLGMPLTLAPSATAFKTSQEKMQKDHGFGNPLAPIPQHQQQVRAIPQSSTMSRLSDMIFGW